MKKFRLILAVCLALGGILGAHAEDIGDVARAATRRVSVTQTRSGSTTSNSTGNSRSGDSASHSGANVRGRNTTTAPRTNGVVERATTTTPRTTGNVVSRTKPTTTPRPATTARTTVARTATRTTAPKTSTTRATRTISRAATGDATTREDVMKRDYSKCKKVFFDCMDEFCANKDAQLKRCACSSRIHEFDFVKKQLAAVEDKMLQFNQRLLTVNMEKEDAAALSIATEGETAYLATKDKTDSKKTLDAIAKKLNTSFDSSNFNSDLNVLSWSLNADSAFDSVDSLMGASTTTKSGTALYSAALPVCREMAAEVCSESDVALAEGGYQAMIEQDCNTVAKTYKTQTEQARSKVFEGSALLDMSRLDIYQKRNSDDILTCKKKMLDMLTNSTVCGEDLGKCLDVTGQYIDPSTGEAFLTTDLVNLANLLKRPSENQTWASVPGNSTFVSYLNSKKKFLEPAMENCQEIADAVWNSFIDDALSQIKIAQDKKLETVRQGCTTLSAQCLSDAEKSITDFDARALSVFGISADITASAMCANVLNACSALLGTDSEWATGVSEIATTTTYETMMQTCRQVGQACIVQVCSSTSGNFGLCESIANSTNRKSIINRTACWDEVKNCIASVGEDKMNEIITQLSKDNTNITTNNTLSFYEDMYKKMYTGTDPTIITDDSNNITSCFDDGAKCIYDRCASECTGTSSLFDCRVCRLAESIWGNCEVPPTQPLDKEDAHNRIIKSDSTQQTLLHWFAVSTGTLDAKDSCRDTTCGIGYQSQESNGVVYCVDVNSMCWASYNNPDLRSCSPNNITPNNNNRCQCCEKTDSYGNCCESRKTIFDVDNNREYCATTATSEIITTYRTEDDFYALICDDGEVEECHNGEPDGTLCCTGRLVQVALYDIGNTNYGRHYYSPTDSDDTPYVTETFMSGSSSSDGHQCTYRPGGNGGWTPINSDAPCSSTAAPVNWSVVFNNN